jgi:hypothetical protein
MHDTEMTAVEIALHPTANDIEGEVPRPRSIHNCDRQIRSKGAASAMEFSAKSSGTYP